jgi:Asp-tRNA(Asn)/Glu-tRNA(Gln) amidotransferase A subunit family amidase
MFDKIHEDHSKIKVGVLTETPFLPVSASVKRAITITKKALEAEGYQVVDVLWTPEEYEEARNLLIGVVSAGGVPYLMRDLERTGERLLPGVALNMFLMNRGPVARWIIAKILGLIGMGRTVETTSNLGMKSNEDYEKMMKQRYQFGYKISKKW